MCLPSVITHVAILLGAPTISNTLKKSSRFMRGSQFGGILFRMNEKITRKVGEAHAFAQVLETTYAANESVMKELLGDLAKTISKTAAQQKTALQAICDEAGTVSILLPKSEKTAVKITSMGELYVGDQWSDSAEVLEWMSFFVGGAIVHWQLVAGAGAAMGHTSLTRVADAGVVYYEGLMNQLKEYSVAVGTDRAQ